MAMFSRCRKTVYLCLSFDIVHLRFSLELFSWGIASPKTMLQTCYGHGQNFELASLYLFSLAIMKYACSICSPIMAAMMYATKDYVKTLFREQAEPRIESEEAEF